jgi:hypothetical protein
MVGEADLELDGAVLLGQAGSVTVGHGGVSDRLQGNRQLVEPVIPRQLALGIGVSGGLRFTCVVVEQVIELGAHCRRLLHH